MDRLRREIFNIMLYNPVLIAKAVHCFSVNFHRSGVRSYNNEGTRALFVKPLTKCYYLNKKLLKEYYEINGL